MSAQGMEATLSWTPSYTNTRYTTNSSQPGFGYLLSRVQWPSCLLATALAPSTAIPWLKLSTPVRLNCLLFHKFEHYYLAWNSSACLPDWCLVTLQQLRSSFISFHKSSQALTQFYSLFSLHWFCTLWTFYSLHFPTAFCLLYAYSFCSLWTLLGAATVSHLFLGHDCWPKARTATVGVQWITTEWVNG